uniref:Uncharacterized protein n=1 Tax=Aegilops tauschii TaxID=37682 RepID=M8AK15_AEGTA
MGDHVVVNVDGLANTKDDGVAEKPSEAVSVAVVDMAEDDGEDEPLIQAAECRICQEEDSIKNLEKPCTCNGSLKLGHVIYVPLSMLIERVCNAGAMRKETLHVKFAMSCCIVYLEELLP